MQRCNATVNFNDASFFPVTVNNQELHQYFGNVARDMLSEKNIFEMKPLMGSEDFSFFAEVVPGYFYYVGMQNETQGLLQPGHSSYFTVNEDVLPYGAALHASLATRYLLEYQTEPASSSGISHDEL